MNAEDFEGFIDMEKFLKLDIVFLANNELSGNFQEWELFSKLEFGRYPLTGELNYGTTTS